MNTSGRLAGRGSTGSAGWLLALCLGCGPGGAPSFPDPAESMLQRLDTNGSGDLDATELMAPDPAALLLRLDTNDDGVVDLSELRRDAALDADPPQGREVGPGGRPLPRR